MRRTLFDKIEELEKESINIKKSLSRLYEQERQVYDLLDALHDMSFKIGVTSRLGIMVLLFIPLEFLPLSVLSILAKIIIGIITCCAVTFFGINFVDIIKRIKIIHKYGYKYRDTKKYKIKNGCVLGKSKIESDLDKKYLSAERNFYNKLDNNQDTIKMLCDLELSKNLGERLDYYNEQYKKRRSIFDKDTSPLIEDILKSEWEAYIDEISHIKPQDIDLEVSHIDRETLNDIEPFVLNNQFNQEKSLNLKIK